MTYKKKLIEVALPLDAINDGARRDKGRSTGTIRSLHKWFAPMPTAAVRALIAATLIDAPEDEEESLRSVESSDNWRLRGLSHHRQQH